MKAMDFLDTLFFDPDITIRDMHKGLTNQNFLLEMNQETYVLRIPRADSEHIVNRHHETLWRLYGMRISMWKRFIMMKQAAIRLHGICRMPEPTGNAKTPASWSGQLPL